MLTQVDPDPRPLTLATIGYERASLAEVIDRLKAADVAVVVAIRAVASSRRAGFSKSVLAASLAEAGIDYRHRRALGTPKRGREAARKGCIAEMRAILAAHMREPEAQDAVAALAALAHERRVALLCFEADAAACRRHALVEMLGASGQDL